MAELLRDVLLQLRLHRPFINFDVVGDGNYLSKCVRFHAVFFQVHSLLSYERLPLTLETRLKCLFFQLTCN